MTQRESVYLYNLERHAGLAVVDVVGVGGVNVAPVSHQIDVDVTRGARRDLDMEDVHTGHRGLRQQHTAWQSVVVTRHQRRARRKTDDSGLIVNT